jgi:hypothetical protein
MVGRALKTPPSGDEWLLVRPPNKRVSPSPAGGSKGPGVEGGDRATDLSDLSDLSDHPTSTSSPSPAGGNRQHFVEGAPNATEHCSLLRL